MNFRSLIQSQWPPLVLLFIVLILSITNYTPGAFLTGWDNLQTELNPTLAIKRAFFSSWQEYQSFGLAAGMAHAADLMRSLFTWITSFLLPLHLERFFFHMLMVFVGGLGMLVFLGMAGFKKFFALLGALFYILNFNTIQMMFLPFEPFSIFFALLPWQIWIFLKLVGNEKNTRADWLVFLLITILATSQAVVQQLFVVLFIILGLLAFGLFLSKRSFSPLKKAIVLLVIIVGINSFWILPQLYFLKTAGSVVKTAKINQLATEDIFFSNKDKGNIQDFLKNEGFIYDRLDSQGMPLFAAWRTYRQYPPIIALVYALSLFSLVGILVKSRYRFPFLLIYLLILLGFLNNTFPFEAINTLIRKSDFANQIFRSPFTKFSIPYAFMASYFFPCAASFLADRLGKPKTIAFLLGLLLIIHALPAFQGNYISPKMKVKIPEAYLQTIDLFKTKDKNKRIALLPEYTHWGWFVHTWGYDGSGFLWYGIEQPIVSRTFDVWSAASESYYWEAKESLESHDVASFERVLEKYNIDYLILDRSTMAIIGSSKTIQYDVMDTMLGSSDKITLEKKIDFLSVYKVNHAKKITNFVSVASNLPNIGPSVKLTNSDSAYQRYGDYVTEPEKPYAAYYPFLDLTTQTRMSDAQWKLRETPTSWILNRKIPKSVGTVASFSSDSAEMNLYDGTDKKTFSLPYEIKSDNDMLSLEFPKIAIKEFHPGDATITECVVYKTGVAEANVQEEKLTVTSKNGGTACFYFNDRYISQEYGYIVKVKNKNITGRGLFFYVVDGTNDQVYVEDRLSQDDAYYILGSRYKHGIGYTFAFQNNSNSNTPSVNELEEVIVYLMPYDIIKQFNLTNPNLAQTATYTIDNFRAQKVNNYTYFVSTPVNEPVDIILAQSYQVGWKAYNVDNTNRFTLAFPFLAGKELPNHVLVNNWENGWILDDKLTIQQINNSTIVLVYLPQYLEYVGFGILGITIFCFSVSGLWVFSRRRNR